MIAAAHQLAAGPAAETEPKAESATALVVVFPALAQWPEAMTTCIAGFRGSKIVIVSEAGSARAACPDILRAYIDACPSQPQVIGLSTVMFGNRRGLVLPVDVAVRIAFSAGLAPEQDQLLLTGCYRGWQPGSIDLLAEALSAIRFNVGVDEGVMRR
jgi:hypothetical protein